ncbi:DUF4145 domain-containing protein [bacterium]|nr:DUF4145 domain-containing protein [bacterium]
MPQGYLDEKVKCPVCGVTSQALIRWCDYIQRSRDGVAKKDSRFTIVTIAICPECLELLFLRQEGIYRLKDPHRNNLAQEITDIRSFYPPKGKLQLSKDIPEEYRTEAQEAHLCLEHSAAASALLSRRLLQKILRKKFKVLQVKRDAKKWTSLFDEIKDFLDNNPYAPLLKTGLEHIRQLGNIAAHPPGEEEALTIVDISYGDAKYLLNFITKQLFQVAFINEAEQKRMDAALNPPAK